MAPIALNVAVWGWLGFVTFIGVTTKVPTSTDRA